MSFETARIKKSNPEEFEVDVSEFQVENKKPDLAKGAFLKSDIEDKLSAIMEAPVEITEPVSLKEQYESNPANKDSYEEFRLKSRDLFASLEKLKQNVIKLRALEKGKKSIAEQNLQIELHNQRVRDYIEKLQEYRNNLYKYQDNVLTEKQGEKNKRDAAFEERIKKAKAEVSAIKKSFSQKEKERDSLNKEYVASDRDLQDSKNLFRQKRDELAEKSKGVSGFFRRIFSNELKELEAAKKRQETYLTTESAKRSNLKRQIEKIQFEIEKIKKEKGLEELQQEIFALESSKKENVFGLYDRLSDEISKKIEEVNKILAKKEKEAEIPIEVEYKEEKKPEVLERSEKKKENKEYDKEFFIAAKADRNDREALEKHLEKYRDLLAEFFIGEVDWTIFAKMDNNLEISKLGFSKEKGKFLPNEDLQKEINAFINEYGNASKLALLLGADTQEQFLDQLRKETGLYVLRKLLPERKIGKNKLNDYLMTQIISDGKVWSKIEEMPWQYKNLSALSGEKTFAELTGMRKNAFLDNLLKLHEKLRNYINNKKPFIISKENLSDIINTAKVFSETGKFLPDEAMNDIVKEIAKKAA